MCVDREKMRCCCGAFSLTVATVIIGVLYLISAISSAIQTAWAPFVVYLIMAGLLGSVLVQPNNAGLRKIIYYTYVALAIAGAVGILIWIIYAFASASYVYEFCAQLAEAESASDCVGFFNTLLIIIIVIVLLVFVPCTLCTMQILYYGWKEQENVEDDFSQSKDTSHPHQVQAQYQPV